MPKAPDRRTVSYGNWGYRLTVSEEVPACHQLPRNGFQRIPAAPFSEVRQAMMPPIHVTPAEAPSMIRVAFAVQLFA